MKRPLRVAAIHDLSTFGRCALSVVLPILSSMGIQVCPVPTMLLSTHTGGFDNIRRMDCADFSSHCAEHYTELGVELECVYSGYLGDTRQIAGVLNFYKNYPNALKIADPVLGDNGRFYNGITSDLVEGMKNIVAKADIITPNLTEATLLTDTEYKSEYKKDELISLCRNLAKLTKGDIIITGVPYAGMRGNVCYTAANQRAVFLPAHYRHTCFDGTGDTFASVLTGAYLKGASLQEATSTAAEFVEHCIDISTDSGEPNRDGIFLETALPRLNAEHFAKPEIIELTNESRV